MFQSVAGNVQQGLVLLLVLGGVYGVGYLSTVLAPKAKKFVDAHLDATAASKVDAAIDGLTGIAEAVVQHFNQTVVQDAKAAGTFTPEVAKSVLNDAISAVKSQGASFVSTLTQSGNDANGLVVSKIEAAVSKYKLSNAIALPISSVAPTQEAPSTAPQTSASSTQDSAPAQAPAQPAAAAQ